MKDHLYPSVFNWYSKPSESKFEFVHFVLLMVGWITTLWLPFKHIFSNSSTPLIIIIVNLKANITRLKRRVKLVFGQEMTTNYVSPNTSPYWDFNHLTKDSFMLLVVKYHFTNGGSSVQRMAYDL